MTPERAVSYTTRAFARAILTKFVHHDWTKPFPHGTCPGSMSCSVQEVREERLDGKRMPVISIYSYGLIIARWWLVPVGAGTRLMGWNWKSISQNVSATTARHVRSIPDPTEFGGTAIEVVNRHGDTADVLVPIETLLVALDKALEDVGTGFAGPVSLPSFPLRSLTSRAQWLPSTMPWTWAATHSDTELGVIFRSKEIGYVTVDVWRDSDRKVRVFHIPRMDPRNLLNRGPELFQAGLRGSYTPRKIHVASPTHGHFVSARGKVVGHWRAVVEEQT